MPPVGTGRTVYTAFPVDQVVHDLRDQQRERGRGEDAEDEAPGEAGEDWVQRDHERPEHRGARGQEHRPKVCRAGFDQRFGQIPALLVQPFDKVDQDDRVADDDTCPGLEQRSQIPPAGGCVAMLECGTCPRLLSGNA